MDPAFHPFFVSGFRIATLALRLRRALTPSSSIGPVFYSQFRLQLVSVWFIIGGHSETGCYCNRCIPVHRLPFNDHLSCTCARRLAFSISPAHLSVGSSFRRLSTASSFLFFFFGMHVLLLCNSCSFSSPLCSCFLSLLYSIYHPVRLGVHISKI